jgi:hypothetical protein
LYLSGRARVEDLAPELVSATVDDLDEERLAIRVRPEAEKNERYRYLHLPEALFAAVLETLPPHEDREEGVSLFPGLTDARLRMAIAGLSARRYPTLLATLPQAPARGPSLQADGLPR